MNIEEFMLVIICCVFIITTLLFKKKKGDFFLGRKNKGIFETTLSVTASWIGVTSMLVLSSWIFDLGHAAIWYLASPSIFLILLGLFGTSKIRKIKGVQLGDYFENKNIKKITIMFISIVYMLVLGAQIVGFANISQVFNVSYKFGLILSCLTIVVYLGLGGFDAVSKTDIIQAFLIFLTLFGLFFVTPIKLNNVDFNAMINPFSLKSQFSVLFLTQGLLMIVAQENHQRIKAAKSDKTAKISIIFSGIILLVFTLSIYLLTISIGKQEQNSLLFKISQQSTYLKIFFSIGFLGAALSTADTALNISSYSISSLINPKNKKGLMWLIIIFTTLIAGSIALFLPSIKTITLIAINLYIGVLLPIMLLKLLDYKGKLLSIIFVSCLISFIGAIFIIPIAPGILSLSVGVLIFIGFKLLNFKVK